MRWIIVIDGPPLLWIQSHNKHVKPKTIYLRFLWDKNCCRFALRVLSPVSRANIMQHLENVKDACLFYIYPHLRRSRRSTARRRRRTARVPTTTPSRV